MESDFAYLNALRASDMLSYLRLEEMASIPDNFIDDLIARVELDDLIGRYITLKKTGTRFMGVCPFHGDSNPSLSVTPDKGFLYCFGCQEGGDAITFVRKQENLDFVEAVQFIARLYGIPVPEAASDPHATRRRTLIDINDKSREFFIKVLKSKYGKPFIDYLKSRGFTKETVLAYRVGASFNSWDHLTKHLTKEGFKNQDMVDAGVAISGKDGKSIYDRFRGRLMIPILDTLERTLGFGGRAMGDDEPKYINSPESPIFQKSKVLFGLDLAKSACRDSGQLILMEGYTDVMQAWQAGVQNCCAVMGTALTPEHLPIIARFAGEVIMAFDGDEAGIRATTRSMMAFAGSDLNVKVLPLPSGSDPADIIRTEGAEKFRERAGDAIKGEAWLFRTYGEPVRNSSITDRIKAFEDVAPYLIAYSSHPIYDELQERAAIAFNLNLTALRTAMKNVAQGSRTIGRSEAGRTLEAVIKGGEEIEKVLFLSLIANPKHLPEVKEHIEPEDFDQPLHRRLARVFFQPGFALGTPEGLKRLREINEDEDLYSYVVRLILEHDEEALKGSEARYSEADLKFCLLHMIRRNYEAESKRIQSEIQGAMPDMQSGDTGRVNRAKELISKLGVARQELENDFREISYQLGGEKVSWEEEIHA